MPCVLVYPGACVHLAWVYIAREQTNTTTYKCAGVAHTLVHCLAQCQESKSQMGPVLNSTASAMAGLDSLTCLGQSVPVAQFIGQDLKAQGIQDRLAPSKIAGDFCELCQCDYNVKDSMRARACTPRSSTLLPSRFFRAWTIARCTPRTVQSWCCCSSALPACCSCAKSGAMSSATVASFKLDMGSHVPASAANPFHSTKYTSFLFP